MKTKKTVLCFILAVALILPNTVFAAEAATPSTGAYGLLEEFVTDNPSRTAGTAGEGAAADWIENKLKEFGYTDDDISRQTFSIENYLSAFRAAASRRRRKTSRSAFLPPFQTAKLS